MRPPHTTALKRNSQKNQEFSHIVDANDSHPIYSDNHSITQIELLNSQLNRVGAEVTQVMKFYDSVLMTIPGIDYISGGMLLGEIDDIHRFSNPLKPLAFAGLTPSVYQSGN